MGIADIDVNTPIARSSDEFHQPLEFKTLYDVVKASARKTPNAAAIGAPGRRPLTYARLVEQIEKTVSALRTFGIGQTDPVAVVLPNGPEMAVAFLGVAAGAACAPLNPSYRLAEFDFYLSDLNAKALIVAAGMTSPAREVADRRNIPIIELVSHPEDEAGAFMLTGRPAAEPAAGGFCEADHIALLLHTSGTTSRPKMVPLRQSNICSTGRNIVVTLQLTARDCCLNVMPLFHIHGLMAAVVSSLTAGASVVCSPGFAPDKFFDWLDQCEPTWYTAVPTIHQAILARADAHREIVKRRPLRFIRSSSASMPEPVMADLEKVLNAPLIEAYGMTEAAHQMASNPLPPLPRKPGSVGRASGPDVAIMDAAGNLLPFGQIGEVVIRGANVTAGYLNNPTANDSAFTDGWFRTGDQGYFDADGYLFLKGRLKEIINRGGEKISPREVDDILMEHQAVAQAVAFAVPHPTLGEEVAAAVVLKPGCAASENELREFAATRLSDFKVPKQILILDEIPKGPTGKLQRIGLATTLADALARKREDGFVAATTNLETQLIEIWERLLKVSPVGIRDDFRTLGGDSLSMVTMLIEVEDRFDVRVPVDRFLTSPTIETIVSCIERPGAADPQSPRKAPAIKDSWLSGLRNRLLQVAALYAPGFRSTRIWLHRMRGVTIGNNVSIGLSTLIETAYPSLVYIGNNVSIGMRAVIIGHLRDSTVEARVSNRHTVRIEDDVYVGPGVIVLPNVTIGRGAVVSAGSVVSKSIPPHTLVQGNPAKPVARCSVSLGGGVSYEEFIRGLTPLDQ